MEKIIDSRTSILSKIKAAKPQERPLPEIPLFAVPGSPLQNFIAHLKGFDGDYKIFSTREEAIAWLSTLTESKCKKIFSAVPEFKGNVVRSDFKTPADMNIIDICIGEAVMAVGETGSLLVDTRSLDSVAAALFSTDLYLLVDRNTLLPSLQEAYSKTDLSTNRYSAFFSGPSATADIEAVHITGAQGEISLTAVIYNCNEEDQREIENIIDRLPQGTPLGQPDAPILSLRRETDLTLGEDSV